MKKIFILSTIFYLILASVHLKAQTKKYFIGFTDKNNSPYSIQNPEQYLSQRAINRRLAQNIPINQTDLPVNPQYINAVKNFGVSVITKIKWLNGIIVETNNPALISQIETLSFVRNTKQLNREVKTTLSSKFSFEFNNEQLRTSLVKEQLHYDYGASNNQVKQIGCDCLHQLGYKGNQKMIAVLDAGFPNANTLTVFDSALSTNRIIAGFDFVANNNQVFDDHPHGTYVLSAMVSEVPGQLVGTAPKATYVLIRTEDAATEYIIEEYYWVAGAEYADSIGADIINSSLGYTVFDDSTQNHTYQEMDGDHTIAAFGADMAASKGIVVNVSAGNSGNSSWYYIGTPADADSALTVGAVDSNGVIASFSSKGPASDGAIKPNLVAQGVSCALVDPSDVITTGSGTSFSSPINAGAVACLWEAYPQATNMQLIDAIQRSASYYNNPNNYYGYGIPNYCLALSLLTGKDPRENPNNHLEISPNPFNHQLFIKLYTRDTQTINISINDISGKIILSENHLLYKNSYNIIEPNLPKNLSEGTYIIKVISSQLNEERKLIKLPY
jgi:hypothetical protein